ncbi:Transposase, Mutator family [Thorsellia anophelis DSM 18579]|uniref:Mutator family transposase n=1 Tax=Thorsellia anophelis DSM 18579 TaxID=1123402 RepID=A0A1I0FKA2_9GAMM|nr:Transposase, Mutator family [Thorsellia anophelis DSM 18579]
MDEKQLKALATEFAKNIKTEADLNQFSRMMKKIVAETALNAELTEHLRHCRWFSKSLKYVAWKDYKAVTTSLKQVYQAVSESAALSALEAFAEQWDGKYPQISKSWRSHWENLNTFFNYPEDIRKAIYTTNAIESLNSVIRHAIKKSKVFPNEDSVKKVVYLAIEAASKKWTMPIRNWKQAPLCHTTCPLIT